MTSSQSIKVGDKVRVIMSRRYGHGKIWAGRVTKVARKYATAEYEVETTYLNGKPKREKRTIEFDMATGIDRYAHGGTYGDRVRTPAQLEEADRRTGALAALRDHGIEFRPGRERTLTLKQVEALAEVVKSWEG